VQTAGAFTLGGRGWLANLVAFAYAVAAIIILSIQIPHTAGSGFLERRSSRSPPQSWPLSGVRVCSL
jgi:hypothetical protein